MIIAASHIKQNKFTSPAEKAAFQRADKLRSEANQAAEMFKSLDDCSCVIDWDRRPGKVSLSDHQVGEKQYQGQLTYNPEDGKVKSFFCKDELGNTMRIRDTALGKIYTGGGMTVSETKYGALLCEFDEPTSRSLGPPPRALDHDSPSGAGRIGTFLYGKTVLHEGEEVRGQLELPLRLSFLEVFGGEGGPGLGQALLSQGQYRRG